MCSGSFKESYIVLPVLLFFTCTLGVLFSQFSVIDYFVFYFVERNHWKNCSLLIVIFHVEYKINFIISVVTTPTRMKIPCTLYFATFLNRHVFPLLVGGKVVFKKKQIALPPNYVKSK